VEYNKSIEGNSSSFKIDLQNPSFIFPGWITIPAGAFLCLAALDNSSSVTIMLTRDEEGGDTVVRTIPDRGRRKEEITQAFWRMEPSRARDKQKAYEMALVKIGITTPQDLEILISVVQDAIMRARREGLTAEQLVAFWAWLLEKRLEG
jgi:hypothetical protein